MPTNCFSIPPVDGGDDVFLCLLVDGGAPFGGCQHMPAAVCAAVLCDQLRPDAAVSAASVLALRGIGFSVCGIRIHQIGETELDLVWRLHDQRVRKDVPGRLISLDLVSAVASLGSSPYRRKGTRAMMPRLHGTGSRMTRPATTHTRYPGLTPSLPGHESHTTCRATTHPSPSRFTALEDSPGHIYNRIFAAIKNQSMRCCSAADRFTGEGKGRHAAIRSRTCALRAKCMGRGVAGLLNAFRNMP